MNAAPALALFAIEPPPEALSRTEKRTAAATVAPKRRPSCRRRAFAAEPPDQHRFERKMLPIGSSRPVFGTRSTARLARRATQRTLAAFDAEAPKPRRLSRTDRS